MLFSRCSQIQVEGKTITGFTPYTIGRTLVNTRLRPVASRIRNVQVIQSGINDREERELEEYLRSIRSNAGESGVKPSTSGESKPLKRKRTPSSSLSSSSDSEEDNIKHKTRKI
uniref:Uncharacterized protein n=1 Tax=Cacopsylla melanoneura TaxID=428564 RepID=A0A8D9EQB1_9HEMI